MHIPSRLTLGSLLLALALSWMMLGCRPAGSDSEYRSQIIKRDDVERNADSQASEDSAESAESNLTDSSPEADPQEIAPEETDPAADDADSADPQAEDPDTEPQAEDERQSTDQATDEDEMSDEPRPEQGAAMLDRPDLRPGAPIEDQVRSTAIADRAAAEEAEPFVPPPPPKKGSDGVLDLTFDHIKFDMQVGEKFERSMLPDRIEDLSGQRIRIRGYILPGFQQRDIQQFVLVRDNMECCFGPGAALYDCVLVEMQGRGIDFTVRPVTVEGVFDIDEYKSADGEHLAIYRMDGKSVK